MNEALRDWVANVARHVLLHRHGGRAASLSGDGARFPVDHRPRDARADACRPKDRLPDLADRLHRRRLQCHGPVPSVPRRARRSRSTASKLPASASNRASTRPRLPAAGPACCTATAPICCMDDDGQIEEAHSISAGLDYPGIGPEHAWLNDMARVKFLSATDDEAVAAFQLCSKLEGIIPALGAGARARPRARPRAAEAEGSPDGGQSLRPRR